MTHIIMKKTWIVVVVIAALGATAPSAAHAAATLGTANTTALTGGLIGYWSFDGSATNWATGKTSDLSASNNTGTIVNIATTTAFAGKVGQALTTDTGVCSMIQTASSVVIGSSWTAAWWSRFPLTNNGTWRTMFRGTTADHQVIVNASGDLGMYDNGGTNFNSSGYNINNLKGWHHITAVGIGSVTQFYIDSVYVGSANHKSTNDINYIGNYQGCGQNWGSFDELRIYSRVLSPTEIVLLYAAGVAKTGQASVSSSGWSIGMNAGLVVHWTFDGGKTNWATGTAQDSSGTGNTASLVLMSTTSSPVAGKIGGALRFDGSTTQYAQVGGISSLGTANQPYTMSAWIRPTSANQTGDVLHVSAAATGLGWCLSMVQLVNGQAKVLSWIGSPVTVTGTTSMRPGQWYHVVNTWDATGGLRVYVDGVLENSIVQGTFTAGGSYVTVASPVSGAGCSNDAGTGFAGSVDDVRIYSRSISPQEVYQLYKIGGVTLGRAGLDNSGKTTTLASGLISHWTFDGPRTNWTTGQATDSSGMGNTGTLVNMSTSTSPTIGKIGGALRFDGSTTYITTPTQSISNTVFVSAWVYSSNFNQNGFIIGKNPVNTQWELFFEGSVVRWRGGAAENTVFCPIPQNNKWHFIAGTQTGTVGALYIDGVLCDTGTLTVIGNGGGTIEIGRFSSSYYFNGIIDDVRIYNRALSVQEVYQLYKDGK